MTNIVNLNVQRKRFQIPDDVSAIIKRHHEDLTKEEIKLFNMELVLKKQLKRVNHRNRTLWEAIYREMGVDRNLRFRLDTHPEKANTYTLTVED